VNKAILLALGCALLASVSGCGSSSTTITPPTGVLFAANTARPGSMSAFTVTTGALGFVTGSPFATTGNSPLTLAAVSDKFLYAGLPTSGGVITTVLGRQAGAGAPGGILLMPIKANAVLDTPQLFASGGDYGVIAVTPSGNALYAADQTNNQLAAFSIDSTKGTLTTIGPQGPPAGLPVGFDPFSIAIDPLGRFVFVANCDCTAPHNPPQGTVSVFSINPDGTLSNNVLGSPFHLGAAAVSPHPVALAVSPDSKFLFVASLAETIGANDEVYVESIGANGILSDAVAGAPSVPLPVVGSTPVTIAVGSNSTSITAGTPDGAYVYTGNTGNETMSFFLNCLLTPLPAGCPSSGNPPTPLAPLAHQSPDISVASPGAFGTLVADPVGGFLYIPDFDHGRILAFSIASCSGVTVACSPGTLSQGGSAVNTGGAKPFGLAITPIPTSK
jgi:DNA-binding beta-propeller fold protein YncE